MTSSKAPFRQRWEVPSQHKADIAEFLTIRRAKITPEQACLPAYGARRVPGLRGEEVASLAGVSVEHYKRLERGNVSGVSELVLDGLARALQLDDAERAHLFDLARAANPVTPKRRRPVKQRIRPVVQRILDQITTPATVRNARLDNVGANPLGRALYAPVFDSVEQPANSASRRRSWAGSRSRATSTAWRRRAPSDCEPGTSTLRPWLRSRPAPRPFWSASRTAWPSSR